MISKCHKILMFLLVKPSKNKKFGIFHKGGGGGKENSTFSEKCENRCQWRPVHTVLVFLPFLGNFLLLNEKNFFKI